jgi:hypothetical protein
MNKITLNTLSALDRELLKSVSIPDLALGALPPAKLMQTNNPELLDRPEADDNVFVSGAIAGGWVLPTAGGDGRVFMPVPPGFDLGVVAFTQRWVTGEIDGDGKFQMVGEPYAEKPPTARWRPDPDRPGKKIHKIDNGLLVREELGVVMLPEATGQICHYVGRKTATKVVRAFSNRAQRLTVDGLGDGIRGCVLARFRVTSFLKTEDKRSWHVPVFAVLGKVGEERGPSMERVLELARMRDAYLKGAALSEPTAPSASSTIALDGGAEPPAHDRYDGPDDDVDFS